MGGLRPAYLPGPYYFEIDALELVHAEEPSIAHLPSKTDPKSEGVPDAESRLPTRIPKTQQIGSGGGADVGR